jgi:branched-chain amino acid transport system permease protein
MTLLAMGEAIQVIGYNYKPIIKGNIGVIVPDPFRWAGESRYIVVAIIVFGLSILVFFYLEKLIRSPLGRMLRAIRDNDDAAEALGKDITRIRMKTIMLASIFGSIGGALDAFKAGGIISTSYHRVTWTFWPWVIVVLGGTANNTGIALGTFIFVAIRRIVDFYKGNLEAFIPFSVVWLDYLFLGIMIILIQMYRPEGIIKEKPTPTINLKKFEKSRMSGSARERD